VIGFGGLGLVGLEEGWGVVWRGEGQAALAGREARVGGSAAGSLALRVGIQVGV